MTSIKGVANARGYRGPTVYQARPAMPAHARTPLPLAEEAVLNALRRVDDPEVGVNIVDLGLVYAVEVTDGSVRVDMTMTTAACPMAGMLVDDATDAIEAIVAGGTAIDVRLVWEPAWTPDRMTSLAKELLGWTG